MQVIARWLKTILDYNLSYFQKEKEIEVCHAYMYFTYSSPFPLTHLIHSDQSLIIPCFFFVAYIFNLTINGTYLSTKITILSSFSWFTLLPLKRQKVNVLIKILHSMFHSQRNLNYKNIRYIQTFKVRN